MKKKYFFGHMGDDDMTKEQFVKYVKKQSRSGLLYDYTVVDRDQYDGSLEKYAYRVIRSELLKRMA